MRKLGILLSLCVSASMLRAQGTAADYERSAALPERWSGKIFRDRVRPQWLQGGKSFWYRNDLANGAREFVLVDAVKGTRELAFDHAKVAAALEMKDQAFPFERVVFSDDLSGVFFQAKEKWWKVERTTGLVAPTDTPPATAAEPAKITRPRPTRRSGPATVMTFENKRAEPLQLYWIDEAGTWKNYGGVHPHASREMNTYAGHIWLVADGAGHPVATYEAQEQETKAVIDTDGPQESRQPNRRSSRQDQPFEAEVKDGNIVIKIKDGGESFVLTTDGTPENGYQNLEWSPDGNRLAALKVKRVKERQIHIVQSSPRDQLQPKLKTLDYAKPGDEIDHPQVALFDVQNRKAVPVSQELCPTPWSIDQLRWSADGKEFTALYNQRGHQVLRLLAVDGQSGAMRLVIEEKSPTFIDYTNKVWSRKIEATNEWLWMSEQRDGWAQLYLFDAATGALKNRVTNGEWVVTDVVSVDEAKRTVLFAASGVIPGQDPYFVHLCRVNFDGSGFKVLTEGDGTHSWEFSPDQTTFLDRWSRVDQPTITQLRRLEDGGLICELEKADIGQLTAAGFAVPERFVAKARDGKTDIYGIIVRPSNFDPQKKYPVIEKIYAGPQGFFVPKNFGLMTRDRQIAELGFIWVQIDGLGTNGRSKAFHDVCFKNLQDAGFPDRKLWIKAAAAQHSEMDLTPGVGIYGGSAGGQNAMRALIDHHDLYTVAVADCGCHDNRMDKIWWNEQWMSWPLGPEYEAASNTVNAHKLKGHLFLTVGEVDTNVDPASTMQVVNALIKANKDFDFLIVPGENHGVGEQPYPARRRMDFFVRHLWKKEPRS